MTSALETETMTNLQISDKAPLLPAIEVANLNSVAIIGGAGVDPDGLASVEAMATIVLKINPEADVYKFYNGKFDMPQNKTMRELLGLNHLPVAKYTDGGNYTCLISVDGPASVCPATPDFIIDHHPENGAPTTGQDVRPIGSCSAIMWEYCMEAGIDFTTDTGAKLATALAIGICTDTREKTTETTSDLDFEAEAFCGRHRDPILYNGIKNYPKPEYYMDMLCDGWLEKSASNSCLVTYLDIIPEERMGVIANLADKLSEVGTYDTAVVIANVNGNFVGSVRTTRTSLNLDDFCKSLGVGGGRRGAGRFTVKMPETLSQTNDKDLLKEYYRSGFKILRNKILMYIGDGMGSMDD